MGSVFNKILFCRWIAAVLLKPLLRLHNLSYKLASRYSCVLNNGIHPKHKILKYEEWFLNHITQGDVVLDMGCHIGLLSFLLSDKAQYVYGIEINPDHVRMAQSIHSRSNIEYICADAVAYNYDSLRPVNCVILSNVLEHIEKRVEFLRRIIGQVRWADGKNKVLLFRVPMLDRDWIVLFKKELGVEYRLDSTHCIEYTVEQFRDELRQAGIVVESIEIRFGEIYAVCKVV